MNYRSVAYFLTITLGLFPTAAATGAEKPKVESFSVAPATIELTSSSTRVSFQLIVSHPLGIENEKVEVSIINSRNDTYKATLRRAENPIDLDLRKVTFSGFFDFPRNATSGIYFFDASSISNINSDGYQYETGLIEGPVIRTILGAEKGILVTNFGNLDLDYDTFVGPTYDTTSGTAFNDIQRYNSGVRPVWRVGESYDPNTFFESRIKDLKLILESSTLDVCKSDGKKLTVIKEGKCSVSVATARTSIYKEKKVFQTATILAKKKKIELFVETISDQTSDNLPKSIIIPPVIGGPNIYVMPKSTTPTICYATDLRVTLLSGGTCILSYQTEENDEYEASSNYLQTIEITRTPQTIEFSLPLSVNLKSKTLTLVAKSSSGEIVVFESSDSSICKIDASNLVLLASGDCNVTASQAGTSTLSPVSKTLSIKIIASELKKSRTIVCIKGSKKIKVKAVKPKCPKGYVRAR